MNRLLGGLALALTLLYHAHAQVIEFESNGLRYQTLTRSGVTVMWAQLPTILHEYSIIQVAVSNGSAAPYVIRPEDFTFVRADGSMLRASPARNVVDMLSHKGSGTVLFKMLKAYAA